MSYSAGDKMVKALQDTTDTHCEDVALLEEDDVDQEAKRHHGDDDDGDAPADDVGPVGVDIAARLQRLPVHPAQHQDHLSADSTH